MAGKTTLATLVLAVVASAALMEGAAATVYFVGDATSWTIPSGGAAFYSTWAANHTFAVGDILVFNFVTGAHDVATVTKTSYDSCSSASPIAIQTTGPANVTLTTSGEHYFICTVGQHCANGQKLSVNVPAAASSPTPTPSPSPASLTPSPAPTRSTTPSPTPSATPPPAPTPAAPTPSPTAHSPPPSSATTNSPPPPPAHSVAALHVIGNSLGWIVPPGGPIAYSTWASVQTFSVGDILMFNFTTGEQDVAIVTKEAYDTCNSTNPILLQTTGPANITLTSAGLHYFIGTIDRHCFLGQKLTVDVTGASGPTTSPAPTPPPPPPSPVVAEPPRAPMTYVVGDALGWIVRPGGPIAYSTWASGKTFFVGDTLVFNFKNGTQDVAQLTMAAYDSCNTTNPTNVLTNSPVSITLTTAGDYFFTSTYSSHCYLGQKLAITVVGTTSGPTSSPAPPPPSTPVPAPPRAPVTYVLLDKLGWIVPPGGLIAYSAWAHDKTFFVGDTLVFNFENGSHDVAEVTEAAYKSCNTTTPGLTLTTSPAKITLTAAGSYFFTSTYPHHCSLGQKLAINVTATSSPTSPPGSIAEPPSNALSPTAGSAPITSPSIAEPPSNAPSPTAGSEPITSPSIAEPPSNAPSPTAGSAPIISPSIAWSPSNILSPADSATTPAPTTAVIGSAPSLAPIAEAPSLAPTTAAISSAPSTATIGLFCAAFLSIVTTFLV